MNPNQLSLNHWPRKVPNPFRTISNTDWSENSNFQQDTIGMFSISSSLLFYTKIVSVSVTFLVVRFLNPKKISFSSELLKVLLSQNKTDIIYLKSHVASWFSFELTNCWSLIIWELISKSLRPNKYLFTL